MNPSKKPILCLDFDGVIHSYTSGWLGAGIANDPPVAGAREFIYEASRHFQIHIYSSRSKSLAGRRCMKKYMRQLLDGLSVADAFICQDWLWEEIKYPFFKPAALITIDDRAITFTGSWPSQKELLEFRPWNKR